MRRTVDFISSIAFLLIVSPLLILLALAVVLDSPGNPFYRAWRIGKGKQKFRMWKFRTMVKDASKLGVITGKNDPRITRLGAFLRRSKMDELPQFYNVLLGDMTLVGPRPESPEIVALYVQRQEAVLGVKPGVTGIVQLESGEESDSIPENVTYEAYYIQHLMDKKLQRDLNYLRVRTPWSDTKIVLRTAAYVLRIVGRAAFDRIFRDPQTHRIRESTK
jgi:lipopolysaccharide/colanic/teichoic acid biosynthesis glycosyltransferase